jgi:monoamine oxidase
MMETVHSVIVIGAGAAGLYAAQMLKTQCPDVLVVEAQDRVGGRIRQARPPETLIGCYVFEHHLQGMMVPSYELLSILTNIFHVLIA